MGRGHFDRTVVNRLLNLLLKMCTPRWRAGGGAAGFAAASLRNALAAYGRAAGAASVPAAEIDQPGIQALIA